MIYIENNLEKQDVFIPRNDGSTCYVSPYDKGYQDGYQDGIEDCGDCPIQQKEVVLTATTETISPDQGYAGMDSVFVDARQLALEKYNEGYHEGEEDGAEGQKNKLASTAFTQNGIYTREDGWSEVEVAVEQTGTTCNLESKTETVTADTQTILPSSGYDGMSEVVLDATNYGQDKYDEGFADGQASVPPCPPCPEIESAVTYGIGSGFTGATITPSSGYDGMAEVTITDNGYGQERYDNGFTQGYAQGQADCPSCPEIESAVTYGIGSGFTGATVTPSSGYDGMAEVTITDNGYGQEKYDEGHDDGYNEGFTDGQTDILSGLTDTTITQNGIYSNPSGWSGVTVAVPQTGSSCNLQQKAITLESGDTSPWAVAPDAGYDGMSGVTITDNGYGQEKYSEGHSDGYDEGYQDGLDDCSGGTCNLEAVSYAIPTGFTGTTITPSSGYDGMSSVAITDGGYGQEKYDEGYDEGYQDGSIASCNLQEKSVVLTAITECIYPDTTGYENYLGFESPSWAIKNLIDTGIYPTQTSTARIKYKGRGVRSDRIVGSIDGYQGCNDNSDYRVFDAIGLTVDVGSARRTTSISSITQTDVIYDITFGNAYVYDNINETLLLSHALTRTVDTGYTYTVDVGSFWLKELIIEDNGVTLFQGTPREENGVAGLYDSVSNSFLTLFSGSTGSTVIHAEPLGYTGLASVCVDASHICTACTCNLEQQNVVMSATNQTFYPSSGYDGIDEITVEASGLCQNYYNDGYAQGQADCSGSTCNLESGQASLGSGWTSPSTVLPSSGYDGLSSVVVTDDGYGQAKYDQGYSAGHTSGYGEGYADGTSANCNTYSLLYVTQHFDTGTITLYPDPSQGTGFSWVAVNLDGYGERRFQDGYREGESSVMKSLFNENDTTYVVGYYYTPTSQVCLITGEYSTQQYDGNLCFSAMSVNGGAWETVQKYLQLSAGWTEIRFQVADANLYGAFAHRFTPSQTCYMDALKAVSIPSNITDLHSKYTFAYNEGIKILSMSSNSAYGMTFYNAPNINVVFSHYAGNSIYISGLPSNGVLFIPTGQTSNYSNVLTDWTHLELF